MKNALLGMPSYGSLTAGAARGLYRASRGQGLQVVVQHAQASLLAQCFNVLWASALTRVHRGEPLDYFAMIHADIEPADGWLDDLIAEMEAQQLDVLGVAVPIKSPAGITSIALARDDGDTWSPHCRLTMTDIHRLPETFTSADVGRPLLLNTGLWVCRFGDWAKQVHFEINDRIVFDKSRNAYVAQVEPEDWYFSRLCHELRLRIGCTRKIPLRHRGEIAFDNTRPWGTQAFDADYVTASPVP